jgi:hypothetical protein
LSIAEGGTGSFVGQSVRGVCRLITFSNVAAHASLLVRGPIRTQSKELEDEEEEERRWTLLQIKKFSNRSNDAGMIIVMNFRFRHHRSFLD